MSKKPKTLTRKQRAARKRIWHIIFYVLLGAAILGVQYLFPDVVDTALDEVHTISQKINLLAREGTTALLTIAGLVYAWKVLRKS